MQVLKITLEGLTTSFRYPHFMQEAQPSFPMPPPATIYGHICSALGEWVDPAGLQFAYHFTAQGKILDYEHIHVLEQSSGKLPGTRLPKVHEGKINLFKREVLFFPRLILYLNRPEWIDAFRAPQYPVVLGRSQDLCSYTEIAVIELEQQPAAYFEHTLLPYDMAARVQRGVVVLMPRLLDYARQRQPRFTRYTIVQHPVYTPDVLQFDEEQPVYVVDPTAPHQRGLPLGLWFHVFQE